MRVEHADPASADETTILIAGLERPLTLMQISDSHLTEVDARDPEVLERGLQLRATFLIKFLV